MSKVIASVIMPTFNTPYSYLEQAVESIINQTFKDFELIIVDDSSTKYNDFKEISKIIGQDNRIIYLTNTHNKGVAGALNCGLERAKGKYVVRMDSDDISEPTRLEKQLNFLDNNPSVSLVAGYAKCFGSSNTWHKSYCTNTAMKTSLIFESCIVHPTVCLRQSALQKYNLKYNENVQNEDYDLWIRCSLLKDFEFATIPEKVLNYRVHQEQVTKSRIDKLIIQGFELRKAFLKELGVDLQNEEEELFANFCLGLKNTCNRKKIVDTLIKIEKQTICLQIYDNKVEYKKSFKKNVLKKFCKLVIKGKVLFIFSMISFIFKQRDILNN